MILSSSLIKLCVFIFGLFIGSFLNVVIFRLHSAEQIVFGRSHCTQCKKELSWYELLPVVSFLMQQGRCRHCGSKLSLQYPIVELATAFLFLLSFIFLFRISYFVFTLYPIPYILYLIFLWVLCSICLVIFVYDLRYLLIPDICILGGSVLLFLAGLLGIWHVPIIAPLFSSIPILWWEYMVWLLVTAFLCALPFFIIVYISAGKWMGLGDVKLAFFMGMALGLHAYLAILVGVFSGAILGIVLMAIGRAGMKTLIPFGPFLVFGTLVVLFWGQEILNYLGGFLWLPL